MERDYDIINRKLREVQVIWYDSVCREWIKKSAENAALREWIRHKYNKCEAYGYSEPFFMGVPDYSADNRPLIMFVGQETNGYGSIEDFDKECALPIEQLEKNIQSSQSWGIKKTKLTMGSQNDESWTNYNGETKFLEQLDKTKIWQFIISLFSRYNVCWNNLNKIHYRTKEVSCIKLYASDKKILSQRVLYDRKSKSLLMHEIDIVQPDLVLFLTGPNNATAMETALNREIKFNPIVAAFDLGNTRAIWTYHPGAVSRFNRDEVAHCIEKVLRGEYEV